jgi:hypothetical protein
MSIPARQSATVIISKSLRTATLPTHGLLRTIPKAIAFEYEVLDAEWPIFHAENI